MGLLSTLKSILGLDTPDRTRRGDVEVTVEREPSAETERAVKEEPPEGAEPEAAVEGEAGAGVTETDESAATADDEEAHPGTGEPLQSITGIGDAYAERLEAAGIEDVADLAAADPEELAEETDLSLTRLEDWIEQATSR
ncbi:MAG: helix-hairpin-helix domain-containing protein [Halodesulfurarchaeum sp.]